jgi:dsDNA-specific endonuclease/ATPase MutS2
MALSWNKIKETFTSMDLIIHIMEFNPEHRPTMTTVYEQLFLYHHKKSFGKNLKEIRFTYFLNTVRKIQRFIKEHKNLLIKDYYDENIKINNILEPSSFST